MKEEQSNIEILTPIPATTTPKQSRYSVFSADWWTSNLRGEGRKGGGEERGGEGGEGRKGGEGRERREVVIQGKS